MKRSSIILVSLFLAGVRTALGDGFEADIRPLLEKYCVECHAGDDASGNVDFSALQSAKDAAHAWELWGKVDELLTQRRMPPVDATQPDGQEIEAIQRWYQRNFVDSIEAKPGTFQPRRLSATEYRNTLRSLFGFDLTVGVTEAEQTITEKSLVLKLLPADPPGKSGYRNDTHSNPLSTQAWEQYSYLADYALEELFSPQRRNRLIELAGEFHVGEFLITNAETLVGYFAAGTKRRPVPCDELKILHSAIVVDGDIVAATKRVIKGLLVSPTFLYRGLLMPKTAGQQWVDDFELAERLSYFIWGDMPDDELIRTATVRQLQDPQILSRQIERMLNSRKSDNLATDFAVQWLLLDEIDQVSDNPPVRNALKSQPIDFFRYLIAEDRPILELVDSKIAFANPLTRKHYLADVEQLKKYRKPKGIEIEIVPNQKLTLNKTVGRGGLLTMPGVLAMNRGPILRGVWMLERILGEHLPDPPADVGQIKGNVPGENLSFRDRFAEHRSNESCALCHE